MVKLLGFITSRGFAISLLLLSSALLVFREIYLGLYSPFFLIIPVLLFLSLSSCAIKRFVSASTRDIAFWGSFVFHAGMLVVIAAASMETLTRFSATLNLLQGAPVALDGKDSLDSPVNPFNAGKVQFLNIELEDYRAAYVDERFPVRYTASVGIGIMEENVYRNIKADIEVNRPFHYEGYTFLFQSSQYSPRLIFKDKDAKIVLNDYLRLSNITANEDSLDIPEAGLKLYTRFFPDVFREDGKVGSRSPVLKKPAFGIRVTERDNPFKDIWKGLLKNGDKAAFNGMTLEFADLKPYVVIEVVKDASYWGIFAGWILIVAGLAARYWFLLKLRPMH